MDKVAERRRKRRNRIIECYKRYYCYPICAAINESGKSGDEVQRLATRSMDFRYGVQMADPNGHWYKTFNRIYIEVEKSMGIRKDGGTRDG